MFLPHDVFGAMMNFMRAMMLYCCALAFSAQAEIPVSNSFDHARTGYMLRDVHTALLCEQCHVDGIFKNTPRDCAGCHSTGSRVGATPKPLNHPQTNKACDVCHTSPTSFLVKNFNHAGITKDCTSCHNGQSTGVTSKPSNHFPTTLACEACHINTATFTSTRNDHTGSTSNCAQCHGGQYPAITSKNLNTHISTTAACETCHTAANTSNYTTFLGAQYDHLTAFPAVDNRCATCHGVTTTGKTASHITTTASQCDSSGCHTRANTNNFSTFQGAQFAHATATPAVTGICSTCHNGTTATGKRTSHITTTQQCDVCHTASNTGNYTTFAGADFSHSDAVPVVANRCSACHTGQSQKASPKHATHIPTTVQCDVCHTSSNTANYTSFVGGSFAHSTASPAVRSRCSTCHDGQSPSVKSKDATHIPTAVQCDVCHTSSNTANYTSFVGGIFSHSTASPAVANRCSTCHGGSLAGITAKNSTHIATTAQCDGCHTANNTGNYTTFVGATFNHDVTTPAVAGRCSTCHNGTLATGKSSFHTVTSAQCDSSGCHTKTNTSNYTTFLGALVNHAAYNPPVGGRCSVCHNNTSAKGKTSSHITTTAQCDSSGCHSASNTQNYTTFAGASFTHSTASPSVAGRCSACHNGQSPSVVKKPALHIATTAECDSSGCHSASNTQNYTTFLGASFGHTTATPAVAGRCSNCHNGTNASGKSSSHITTTAQCDSSGCHTASNTQNYTTFFGATFNHSTAVPTVTNRCSACHNGQYANVVKKPTLHTATTAECDSSGCHSASNTQNYTTFTGATFSHATASPPVAARCSECHNNSLATGKPNFHMTTGAQCDTCHTTAAWSPATGSVDHTPYGVGSCTNNGCHNGANGRGLSAGHIPTGTISCDGCHPKFGGAVTSFASPTMRHTVTSAKRCDACHNGSYTAEGNNGGALGKMTNHIPTTITGTNDCTTCHPITVSASVAAMDWATETMNHNGAKGGGVGAYCVTCHYKGVTYQGSMDKKSHEGTSMTKDCSKSGCHKPLGSKGVAYSAWD